MRLPAAIVAVVAPELQVVAALVTVHVRMTVLVPPGPVTRSNALVFVPPGAAVMRTDRFSAVQAVLEDSRVVAATLTGSEPAGRSVASIAGEQMMKTVLELGGS